MTTLDWLIVAGFLVFITGTALISRRYNRSVADFLSANRSAGKYLLAVGDGMAGIGAISVVSQLQMFYEAGFTKIWWESVINALTIFVAVTGWVVYRFRQTRALTLGQFFEMRYSRNFRIFAGILVFVSGLLNFGIFPAVGARFAIYYCGLPTEFAFLGMTLETFPVLMTVLVAIAFGFTFLGGQIAVIITDFVQGIFLQVVFIVVLISCLVYVSWDQISEAVLTAPEKKSLINPFEIGDLANYDSFFWCTLVFQVFYATMGWQGQQAYNSSATNAHAAKMSKALGFTRSMTPWLVYVIVALCAYTILHHADFAVERAQVESVLATVDNESVQSQLRTPVVMRTLLPMGVLGLFCAAMLAAFISTHDTYMHSWGCIFLQDVYLPIRGGRLSPEQHMKFLRFAILGVCVFIVLFSYYFEQQSDIYMFMALTGSIFMGGSGAVIIGGLYWKRGTTAGAWAAMITCITIAVSSFTLEHNWSVIAKFLQDSWPAWFERLQASYPQVREGRFVFTPQEMYFFNMITSSLTYVVVSLLTRQRDFDMDRLLHRGKYAVEGDETPDDVANVPLWRKVFGLHGKLDLDDKCIVLFSHGFLIVTVTTVVVGSIIYFRWGISDQIWLIYWEMWSWVFLVFSVILTVWLFLGGARDMRAMFKTLRTLKRDHADSGVVASEDDLFDDSLDESEDRE